MAVRPLSAFSRLLDLWRGRAAAAMVLVAFAILRIADPPLLESLSLPAFDLLQRTAPRVAEGTPVLIVDVDEPSLARFGQWPWPRDLIARLVDAVASGGPLVIGFDLLFPEPDRMSPQRIALSYPGLDPETRAALERLPSTDDLLAASLARAPTVLGAAALDGGGSGLAETADRRTPAMEQGGDPRPHLPRFDLLLSSLPDLVVASDGQGLVTATPERDGVVRRIPLAAQVGGDLFPALSVEMIRVAAGAGWFSLHVGGGGVEAVSVGDIVFPTAADGRVWVHFAESRDSIFVSAGDVLDGSFDAEAFGNRIVLLGSTGIGLTDFPATPVAARMPGVEIHAQLLETMIAGRMLARIPHALPIELALLVLAGAAIIVTVPMLRPAWAAVPLVVVLLLCAGGAWGAYLWGALLLDATLPSLGATAVFGVVLGASLISADRVRRALVADVERRKAEAQRLEGELEAARAIQMGILPQRFPAFPDRTEFSLHATIEPARAVGGDLYDFGLVDDDHLYFMIGDVSGKGVPASLFMALAKALYKSTAMRRRPEIGEIMTIANAEIARENPTMMFVTVLAGLLDLRTGELQFCSAGHDAPILINRSGAPRTLDAEGGPPLCVIDDFEYPASTVTLAPGDTVFLYTDGVTEALSEAGELYSPMRLDAVLAALPEATPAELVAAVVADVHRHAAGAEPSDDITLLAVAFLGATAERDGTAAH